MANRRKIPNETAEKNKWRAVIALGLSLNVYLLFSFFFGEMGLINAAKIKRNYTQVALEVSALQDENAAISHRIEALQNDMGTIERLARKRLGLVKAGELVYEFIEADPLNN